MKLIYRGHDLVLDLSVDKLWRVYDQTTLIGICLGTFTSEEKAQNFVDERCRRNRGEKVDD